jgi:hypothetical protein
MAILEQAFNRTGSSYWAIGGLEELAILNGLAGVTVYGGGRHVDAWRCATMTGNVEIRAGSVIFFCLALGCRGSLHTWSRRVRVTLGFACGAFILPNYDGLGT